VADARPRQQPPGRGGAEEVDLEVGGDCRLALLRRGDRHRGERFVGDGRIAPPWTIGPREVGKPCASAVIVLSSTSVPKATSTILVPMLATMPVADHSL
jgi:hypothetical protein